jgi:fumarate hydratase subunit alpha
MNMNNIREIDASLITDAVKDLCIKANKKLPEDLEQLIRSSPSLEKNELCRSVLTDLGANLDAACRLDIPICQDTGMAVIFLDIGQDVHITGFGIEDAVNEGVRQGYEQGYLRKSVVSDPLRRVNSGDNTPAVIHISIVPGDKIKIMAAPKGFGSENMSRLKMFTPSSTTDDIIGFVTDSVKTAGGSPCPPIILGVGIGGDFEQCAYLAKKALCRPVSERNADTFYSQLEQKMLDAVNSTGVGAQGFGGNVTALAVNIEQAPTHIAGLPVSVNFGCHVTRHMSTVI